MRKARPFVNGVWIDDDREPIPVVGPYKNENVGVQLTANKEEVDLALAAAHSDKKQIASLSQAFRAKVLYQAAALLEERREEFAALIAKEVGKALKNTRDEVARSIETLQLSAEEVKRLFGETIPGGASERGASSMALTFRVPVGVVAAITPFNAPLNLICHKIGPSFAAGNVTILKPAPQAPLIATALVELLLEAGMPTQAIHMILGGKEIGEKLVQDDRVNLVSFTGGVPGGQQISKTAGMKKVLLELGGNAGTIVHEDANVERAAVICAKTAFSNSGQSCISVQRIYVHEQILDRFVAELKQRTAALIVGNPEEERTDVGCVVNTQTAERIHDWICEALAEGAELIHGGNANGASIEPVILLRPKKQSKVVCQEVFGPVVSVLPYHDLDDAIKEVNESEFGLQAGIFSNSLEVIRKAAKELEVGGVIVNGSSNFRLDHWPYGGIKNSGIGREGPRFAAEEMTEMKMVVLQDLL
ncbi:aldehyde dehydrogenase [Terribacillus saccharophilus]|uniref:Aldehyde dehydrogenase n=1 Tax=Terribacillus saccharophilus TaxID=361277 RepID=A0A075LN18_9BACI|nr:aldehyde dehydrogenase family protein [Terribacillus goriensis]AIF68110.1 aldehyde dehydrogenase [Terribacillus goriensis]